MTPAHLDLRVRLTTARLELQLHRANYHARAATAHDLHADAAAVLAQAGHVHARSHALASAARERRAQDMT